MNYTSILQNNMVSLLLISTTLFLLISIRPCSSFVIPVVVSTTNVRQQHQYQQQQHVTFDSQSLLVSYSSSTSSSSLIRRNLVPHDIFVDMTTTDSIVNNVINILDASTNIILATTEADIAKLNDNEFRPIFMGGLFVMFGGLVSTLIVGMIIDSKNLYVNLVADSYVDGSNDEEFWKNMSDVERTKAQDLLRKVREQSGLITTDTTTTTSSSSPSTNTSEITTNIASSSSVSSSKIVDQQTVVVVTTGTTSSSSSDNKKSSMFSDYE